MSMIQDHILHIKSNITLICKELGRSPEEITLVAVTKFAPLDSIKAAIAAGIHDVGENKVQEALKKYPPLDAEGLTVRKHLIGHLQTNKVKQAVRIFDLIQSVDRLALLEEIQKQAGHLSKVMDILIQVKTSGEAQKYGVAPDEALALLEKAEEFQNIRTVGLMAIAPFTKDEGVIRKCFRDLRKIRDEAAERFSGKPGVKMNILSMGMTEDYRIALEEGSNMIRIGRAIFAE